MTQTVAYLEKRFDMRWDILAGFAKDFSQLPLKRTDTTLDDVRAAVKDNSDADDDLIKHFEKGNLLNYV